MAKKLSTFRWPECSCIDSVVWLMRKCVFELSMHVGDCSDNIFLYDFTEKQKVLVVHFVLIKPQVIIVLVIYVNERSYIIQSEFGAIKFRIRPSVQTTLSSLLCTNPLPKLPPLYIFHAVSPHLRAIIAYRTGHLARILWLSQFSAERNSSSLIFIISGRDFRSHKRPRWQKAPFLISAHLSTNDPVCRIVKRTITRRKWGRLGNCTTL